MGTEPMVDDAGVVRIGSVVFALIRPTPGHEVAFNRWYERDHYYTAGTAAPGVFSAGRFVQPESGWHLALYFVLPGHDPARVDFATDQVRLAADDGRLFTEREHLHTWSYAVETVSLGADRVPLALALDHRYAEIHITMVDGEVAAPAAPAMVLRPVDRIMPSTWEGTIDPDRRRIVVEFGTRPDKALGARAGTDAAWAGRFVPVVFGTDTHVGPRPHE